MTTLRDKRDEIIHSIRLYERQLEQARADLTHVTAAIRIFEASGNAKDMPRGRAPAVQAGRAYRLVQGSLS